MRESGWLRAPSWEKAPPHLGYLRIHRGERPKTSNAVGTTATGTQSTMGTGDACKDKEGTGRVLSLLHSLPNASCIVSFHWRCHFLELLEAALPVFIQLLLEWPQLQAVQLQTDTLPQPVALGWDTASPGKSQEQESSEGCCLGPPSPEGAIFAQW